MDKEFWTPKFVGGENISESGMGLSTGMANTLEIGKEREMIMPVVGDKLRFIVYPYGQLQLVDKHVHTQDGQNIIEVEVEAVKKVRVSYE